MQDLKTVEIEPSAEPTAAVIWLHGLGADGNDFAPIVPELGMTNTRFVFPHAPVRPVTLNNGIPMRAWFDIFDLTRETAPDVAGMDQTAAAITRLIQRENERGIATDRIVLAGFSQGGVMALYVGVTYPQRFAGIIGLSTWLPLLDLKATANQETPILMGHGLADPVVPFAGGEASRDRLIAQGHNVEWHQYVMAHAVCPQEIQHVSNFLGSVI